VKGIGGTLGCFRHIEGCAISARGREVKVFAFETSLPTQNLLRFLCVVVHFL